MVAALTVACGRPAEAPAPASMAPPVAVTTAAPAPPGPRDAVIEAASVGDEPIDELVLGELARAEIDVRQLVVYVGATWCEPCKRFHDAVAAGQLDDDLAGVRFLEFDFDRDGKRLADAGYQGRYLPLFVVPGADGRATDRVHSGGVKGPGAVEYILPRLKRILADD